MLNIKWVIGIVCLMLVQNSFAQIKVNSNASTANINASTAFLDASSSPAWKATTNQGKGMIFPNVDLVALTAMVQTGNPSSTNNPNRFDGMLVYNTATGTSGLGAVAVKPGFYYYNNATTNIDGGTWVSVGSKTSVSVVAVVGAYTALDTDATILCDATTAGFTLTLPDPVTNSGKTYVIRKVDTTNNAVTFSPALKFAIGAAPITSLNYTKTLRVQSDGTSWNIID